MSAYIGTELEIFEYARNWKKYYGSFIKPMLGKNIAEIGAGIGGTTTALCDGTQESWICVEPDKQLAQEINRKIKSGNLPIICQSYVGYISDLNQSFDSILYIDVIEHIEDDKGEISLAANLLTQGGHLFIIVPACQSLYSPFDKMIGHYRRYSRKSLEELLPPSLEIYKLCYLDTVGFFTSLMNKIFLKQNMPTLKQVLFWDRFIIPISKITDKILGYTFGKSLLLIVKKSSDFNQ